MKISDKNQNVGFNAVLNQRRLEYVLKHAKGDTCLEIGSGEGQMSSELINHFKTMTIVDADADSMNRIPIDIRVLKIISTVEKLKGHNVLYDTIVCTNFLEHVDDPNAVLDKLRKFGHKDTVYIFSTPNAHSFNRLIGVELGMLNDPTDLHDGDKAAGHKQVFTPLKFMELLTKSGYACEVFKPVMYKPLPNADMETLPIELVKKLLTMEPEYSGAELFAVCTLEE